MQRSTFTPIFLVLALLVATLASAGVPNKSELMSRLQPTRGAPSAANISSSREEINVLSKASLESAKGNWAEALELLKKSYSSKMSAKFDYTFAQIWTANGDLAKALEHYRIAAKKAPNFAQAHQSIAITLLRTPNANQENVINSLVRACELGLRSTPNLLKLSSSYLKSNMPEEALHCALMVLEEEPGNPLASALKDEASAML